ncbi:solute carrier family 35 member G1-like [Argiope bruennichi]|uniref:solute carrier family 35 member G1-like n=1 Tax=Argiope bruennichi TaxID=94029 RepID=UPI0024947AAB|nr:solute carrier family 35 member G1-like [Argiope bruennichi]XP_055930825.1 solute carrier family 35 member G1-like [Argiope bruennichi]
MLFKRKIFHLQIFALEQSKNDEIRNSKYSPLKGLLFATIASISYSAYAVIVKSIANIHPAQLALYQFIGLFIMCMPETVKCGQNPFGPKDMRIFLILRGILGGISIFLSCMAYRYLPLGESAIITSSTPIFVTVGAWLFLHEPCGIFQSIVVIFTVIGVIFTTMLPNQFIGKDVIYNKENIYGLLAAFGVLLCRTFQILFVRKAKKVHHSVMMFNFGWVTIIEGLILLPLLTDFKWHECGTQWIYILLIGICSFCGQTFQNLSLKCEFAGSVSTMMAAVNITLSFLLDLFFFQGIPDSFSIIGAVIVGLCIIFSGLRKWASTLPENSLQHKRFKWILI